MNLALISSGLVGLCFGSFLGLVADRVPAGGSVIAPPSACDACGRRLGILDLVPVLSWAVLRGRCRTCGARVSARSTWIEIASGIAFVLAGRSMPDVWSAGLAGTFMALLVCLAAIDLGHRRIPNAITYPAVVIAGAVVVVARVAGSGLDPTAGAIGAIAFGGSLALVVIVSRGGMGFGDVKLAALIGLVVGAIDLGSVAVAAGVAILLGGVTALVALLRGGDRRSALPFGPMLAAGGIAAVLVGPRLLDAYLGLYR